MKSGYSEKPLLEMLEGWLEATEGEHFEFKEAKNNFHIDKLGKYCCALANEGGGRLLLGVSDRRPRKVVNTTAYRQHEEVRKTLQDKLFLRIDIFEIMHPDGRVLVFEIPSRPIGVAVKYDGVYWGRETESVTSLSEEKLRVIFNESGHDFSADICPGATLDDLDFRAIETFRSLWMEKSKNRNLENLLPEQLLTDAELMYENKPTYASLILFGKRTSLGRLIGQAETIFEYRSSEKSGPAQQRKEFREGFFVYYNDLWDLVNLRNDTQHYQDGMFVWDIPTFAERTVREALLNALSHRNYQLGGSIFIRQYPQKIIIESPGGFPYGITVDNIIERQNPRNRRLAEAFSRCGLVERSGQGVNLMFEQSIQQGKQPPDYSGTDEFTVVLTLNGLVRDVKFLKFLEKISQETQAFFTTHDFIVLDHIHRGIAVSEDLQPRLKLLIESGAVERISRNRFVLSKRFYSMTGKKGTYTRKKGLDRETNKQLLLKHIRENAGSGVKMEELMQILPNHSRNQIQVLLREMKADGEVHCEGVTNGAYWYPGTE